MENNNNNNNIDNNNDNNVGTQTEVEVKVKKPLSEAQRRASRAFYDKHKNTEEYKQKNSNPHDQHYFWSSWSLAQAYKTNGNQDKYAQLVKHIQTQDYKKNPEFAKRFEAGIKTN